MSEQYTPGKGIHQEDLNALTGYWHRETNHINDIVDSSFKSAQDDAYARGYRRGRDDLIIIRKQRDELLAALEEITNVFATIGMTARCYDDELNALQKGLSAIDSVKANTK